MAYFVGAERDRTTVWFGTVKMRILWVASLNATNLGMHCILVTDVSFELFNITSNQSGLRLIELHWYPNTSNPARDCPSHYEMFAVST